MTTIESEAVTVRAPRAEVFAFLSDMNNIRHLLPADRISDWKSDTDQCSFKVQNAYTITLVKDGSTPGESIKWVSGKGAPFEFDLVATLSDVETATRGQLVCNARINPFLEMMVKSPLKNLFDYMAKQLQKRYEAA
jgi:carbon monoxide dehydrogenase subunit G